MPLVVDAGALEADHREHASQEDVDFLEVGEFLQGSGGDESVVSVIIDYVCAENIKCLVVSLRGEALHESVCVAVLSYAVNDLAAVVVLLEHLSHGADIVLAVVIDGDGDVTHVLYLKKTCGNGILVASVTGKADTLNIGLVLCRQLLDHIPGVIAGAVVNEKHAALVADETFVTHLKKLAQEKRARYLDYFCVLVNGYYDI